MKFQYVLIICFLGISLVPGMLGLLGLFELTLIEESTKKIPQSIESISIFSELDHHAQLIRYYDEVLTQSARNYAFTEDPYWKERYFSFEPLLDKEIRHAIEDGDKQIEEIFKNVDDANHKLITFENEAIQLVDAGDSEMAIALLESESYSENKMVYQNALENYIELRGAEYFDTLTSSTDDVEMTVQLVLENIEFSRNAGFVIVPTIVIFSMIIGVLLSRTLSNPIKKLENRSKLIASGKSTLDNNHQIQGFDEIIHLSKSFDNMEESLLRNLEMEKQIVRNEEKLKKERFTAIGELSGNLAHDIRNPLSVIQNTLDVIDSEVTLNKPLQESMNRANNAIDRIDHQVNSVLNFLRVSPLEIQSINLRSTLNSIIDEITIPENVTISNNTSDEFLSCDLEKFRSIITNIIINSIQAFENNLGQIDISSKTSEHDIIIEISNNGPPIPKETLSRIFEPLYTTKFKGTGLGLASCKHLIELHGGTITALGDPVKFILTLPTKQ